MVTRPVGPGRALVCATVAVLSLLSACGGGGDSSTDATTTLPTTTVPSTTAATTTTLPPTTSVTTSAPTTTEPAAPTLLAYSGLESDDVALLTRPALAAKIDNVSAARPQAGINQADIVYEERVEGGLTRLLAVFHSQDAPVLGPIRSARSTDVPLLTPLSQPLFAWSGANAAFAALIRSVAIRDVGFEAQPSLYERRSDRRAPSNLFTSTEALWAVGHPEGSADDPGTVAPTPAFSYRAPDAAPADGDPAMGVEVSYRGTEVVHAWSADAGGWLRTQNGTPHVDEDGIQVAPANVVVQFVDYKASGQVDSAGSVVPEAVLEGSGEVWVLMDGVVVKGTWSKANVTAPAVYLDDSGDTIELAPGSTWVLLAEPGFATLV